MNLKMENAKHDNKEGKRKRKSVNRVMKKDEGKEGTEGSAEGWVGGEIAWRTQETVTLFRCCFYKKILRAPLAHTASGDVCKSPAHSRGHCRDHGVSSNTTKGQQAGAA